MPGILCCFGSSSGDESTKGVGASGNKDVIQAQEPIAPVAVTVSFKTENVKEQAAPRSATQGSNQRIQSPPVSPNHALPNLLAGGRVDGELTQGLLQGLDLQRRITQLQGHWWTRLEDALELVAKTYSAACASVWILDEPSDAFVALLSQGPLRQAVQPGSLIHLVSEYGANSPSSLTALWESRAAQTFSISPQVHSSNSSALRSRAFPADWKLLYSAHHLTDFLALPIYTASSMGGATSQRSDSVVSGGVLMGTLGAGSAAAMMAAAASGVPSDGCPPHIAGALTLYLSRPDADRISEPMPGIFTSALEQELISLAFAGLLYSNGPEPVRQVCDLVMMVQSASGSGELAAAVASGLQARLRSVLALSPAALMVLVPPRQVSAVVFKDMNPGIEASAAGAMDSMIGGQSSSQTLPLLHPALASVAGGGGGGGGVSYSGSQSQGGGGGLRVQYRTAGIHLGAEGSTAAAASAIERSPSLLGMGLRGEAGAAAASSGVGGTAPTIPNGLASEMLTGGGGGATGRLCIANSRSMGVLHGHNPSGLFSCRLDRLPSRYKALVYPLSHTLLQVVLQQRQDKRAKEQHLRGGVGASAVSRPAASSLRDLCMSAAAVTAPAGGAFAGGWILNDCNEHLHAVHSPSRDVYVVTRVNSRRPHSLVLAVTELMGPGVGAGSGGDTGTGGGGGAGTSAAGGGGVVSGTYLAAYLAFPEKLPRPLLEMALGEAQLFMRKIIAPLVRHRFETNLADEWSALAVAANNLPSPGGPPLRIATSMSASQARHTLPTSLPLLLTGPGMTALPSDVPSSGGPPPPIAESNSHTWLSRLAAGTSPAPLLPPGAGSLLSGVPPSPSASPCELQLEGLAAGEALQQMSVLVSSYMDTLQALQGQLMASDRIAESLRREDLPHLQLLEVLGHGGGGVVFRGKLHALEVAVKVFEVPGDLATAAGLSPLKSSTDTGFTAPAATSSSAAGATAAASPDDKPTAWPAVGDRRVLQRSALELAVTASLSYPHIIQVYSLYTNMVLVKQKPPRQGTSGVQLLELSTATALNRADEGIPCSALCMEYCDMGTLAHAIDQQRFLTVTPLGARRSELKAICTSLLEVALALRHLHARNLAHCDLKPANVLLKSSRRDSRGFTCKLADFGYVSVLKPTTPGARPTILPEEACGTVTHMAPETFIKGQPLDFSVDTFSFGILMWELYTCARPYSDVPEDQIAQRVTLKGLRPTFPPDTPRAYSALARQCWSQDPNERPSSSEIVSAIENMLQIMNKQLPAIPPLKPKAPAATGGSTGSGGGAAASITPPDKAAVPPPAAAGPPVAAASQAPVVPAHRPMGSLNGSVQVAPNPGQSPLCRASPAVPPQPQTPPQDFPAGQRRSLALEEASGDVRSDAEAAALAS